LTEESLSGWLRRRYRLSVMLAAEDFEQFLPAYNALGDALCQWYARRGKRCGEVRVVADIHPWIAGRVREYLRDLRKRPEHAPLCRMPLHLLLRAGDEVLEERTYEPLETAR